MQLFFIMQSFKVSNKRKEIISKTRIEKAQKGIKK
jgi:hypothetical protein